MVNNFERLLNEAKAKPDVRSFDLKAIKRKWKNGGMFKGSEVLYSKFLGDSVEGYSVGYAVVVFIPETQGYKAGIFSLEYQRNKGGGPDSFDKQKDFGTGELKKAQAYFKKLKV